MATITAATKNSVSPTSSANVSSVCDERSPRRTRSRPSPRRARRANAERPGAHPRRLVGDVQRAVPPQRVPRHDDVDEQEHDRDGHGDDGQRVAVGVAVPAGDRRDQEEEDGEGDERERDEARLAVEPPSCRRRGARSRGRGGGSRSTLPVSEPRTTSVSPWLTARRAMISSGAFPNVALRKPPTPGPGVVRSVLGRLADQPGERDERRGGERRRA